MNMKIHMYSIQCTYMHNTVCSVHVHVSTVHVSQEPAQMGQTFYDFHWIRLRLTCENQLSARCEQHKIYYYNLQCTTLHLHLFSVYLLYNRLIAHLTCPEFREIA